MLSVIVIYKKMNLGLKTDRTVINRETKREIKTEKEIEIQKHRLMREVNRRTNAKGRYKVKKDCERGRQRWKDRQKEGCDRVRKMQNERKAEKRKERLRGIKRQKDRWKESEVK